MMREITILLVQNKRGSDHSLAAALQKEGYQAAEVASGTAALDWIQGNAPNLVIFDASQMRSNGAGTCRQIKRKLDGTPLIHIRAAGEPETRSAGADIYLEYPFTARKLINRIRTLLPANDSEEEIVRAGHLTMYLSKKSVDVGGRGEHRLTPKLATLLEEFLRHPTEVLSREHLMQVVWKTNYFGDTRTLDVHIRWLRELIEEEAAVPQILKTVRGVGYVFTIPEKAS
jgi:two-component system, OmpR family, phosphate regulon response regulator PhoB